MKKKLSSATTTFGKKAYDLIHADNAKQDPIQTQQEMLRGIEEKIWQTVDSGRKKIFRKNFYIVMTTKKDPIYPNYFHNMFWYRVSCPTPTYDNNVWLYHYNDDNLEELWAIPDKDTVELYAAHVQSVHPSEYNFLNYILAFKNGDLDKRCRELNNEKEHTPNIILIPEA